MFRLIQGGKDQTDWSDKLVVMAIANQLGQGYSVVKYPRLPEYFICLSSGDAATKLGYGLIVHRT